MTSSTKVHHNGLPDEGSLAQDVASVLADKGYVMYFNGHSSTVYDATSEPPLRVLGRELNDEVEAVTLAVLAYTADDAARPAADRSEARTAADLIRTRATGSTSYLRRVVAHVREALPEVEREAVCPAAPARDRREYMSTHRAQVRAELIAKAEETALRLLPDMMPPGKYELGEVWDGWCEELEDPDSGLIEQHPELTKLGRNNFYGVLHRLSGVRFAKGSGRARYIYVE